MKKDFGVKTWLYPMPVLMIATYIMRTDRRT